MKIEIICPLYNAEQYIENLHQSILNQNCDWEISIQYIVTQGTDKTEVLLNKYQANFKTIQKDEFSHSLTREKAAFESQADIVVFITQDIIIDRTDWLQNLVKPIVTKEVSATFSRQICNNRSIEKYTREKNYPKESYYLDKSKISDYGLKTFFFSDASGAIDLHLFKQLNGYDHKRLPISEDMYFAYKLIMNGCRIKYCADSVVIHSHDFSIKELYDRYFLTGQFFNQNQYLNDFGKNEAGLSLAIYIFKRIIQDRNFYALKQFFPNMLARYIGMSRGMRV